MPSGSDISRPSTSGLRCNERTSRWQRARALVPIIARPFHADASLGVKTKGTVVDPVFAFFFAAFSSAKVNSCGLAKINTGGVRITPFGDVDGCLGKKGGGSLLLGERRDLFDKNFETRLVAE